jgi:hypothetical protein
MRSGLEIEAHYSMRMTHSGSGVCIAAVETILILAGRGAILVPSVTIAEPNNYAELGHAAGRPHAAPVKAESPRRLGKGRKFKIATAFFHL